NCVDQPMLTHEFLGHLVFLRSERVGNPDTGFACKSAHRLLNLWRQLIESLLASDQRRIGVVYLELIAVVEGVRPDISSGAADCHGSIDDATIDGLGDFRRTDGYRNTAETLDDGGLFRRCTANLEALEVFERTHFLLGEENC